MTRTSRWHRGLPDPAAIKRHAMWLDHRFTLGLHDMGPYLGQSSKAVTKALAWIDTSASHAFGSEQSMTAEYALRDAFSLADLRRKARQRLPRAIFDFADGGAETESTLRRNESSFDTLDLVPRPMRGSPTRATGLKLFGRNFDLPVMIGPTGLAGLFWPDGELALARAAAEARVAFCLSHGSVCPLEALSGVGKGVRWMQLYIYTDRGLTRELATRAAESGYDALVLTVDNQLLGNRERDRRNGFVIPPRLTARELLGAASKLGWLWRMRHALPRLSFGNYQRPGETASVVQLAGRMASLLDPDITWADVDALRAQWRGPLLLKGVLHPDEAREAVEHGCDAVIVSNHGGRQLDGAIASVDALPRIADALVGQVPILMDGGIRRGVDIMRALALGATACLVGRPALWGLAVAGEAGVSHMLGILRSELERAMGLCGVRSLAEINHALLARRPDQSR